MIRSKRAAARENRLLPDSMVRKPALPKLLPPELSPSKPRPPEPPDAARQVPG
jgi:hypothetical protein